MIDFSDGRFTSNEYRFCQGAGPDDPTFFKRARHPSARLQSRCPCRPPPRFSSARPDVVRPTAGTTFYRAPAEPLPMPHGRCQRHVFQVRGPTPSRTGVGSPKAGTPFIGPPGERWPAFACPLPTPRFSSSRTDAVTHCVARLNAGRPVHQPARRTIAGVRVSAADPTFFKFANRRRHARRPPGSMPADPFISPPAEPLPVFASPPPTPRFSRSRTDAVTHGGRPAQCRQTPFISPPAEPLPVFACPLPTPRFSSSRAHAATTVVTRCKAGTTVHRPAAEP